MRRPGPKSPAGTSFWRARFFSAIPHSFFSFPLFTILSSYAAFFSFSPSILSSLVSRNLSTLLPSSAPFSKPRSITSATTTTPPPAPSTPLLFVLSSPDKYAFFALTVYFSSDDHRPGGWLETSLVSVNINRSSKLFRSSPPPFRSNEIHRPNSFLGESWRGFSKPWRGYFSRIERATSNYEQIRNGPWDRPSGAFILVVVIHSTFQRPCSIGNCGRDERHTIAPRLAHNQPYFQGSTFPNLLFVTKRTRIVRRVIFPSLVKTKRKSGRF